MLAMSMANLRIYSKEYLLIFYVKIIPEVEIISDFKFN